MPPTQRSAVGAKGRTNGPARGQSTLSFAGKVTKPQLKDAKSAALTRSPAVKEVLSKRVTELTVSKPTRENVAHVVEAPCKPASRTPSPPTEVLVAAAKIPAPQDLTDSEFRALRLSRKHLDNYWRRIESDRQGHRVHQQELATGEKILRYFDVDSQYGPCIGLSRLRRWQRAERLGLNPPIEVLAVLMQEQARGNTQIGVAQMDGIMNTGPEES